MITSALDDRIAAAFLEGAKSEEVAPLIAEAEAAAVCAGEAANRARDKALDPILSAKEITAARRDMADAAFHRDRLQSATKKLMQRLDQLKAEEEQDRRWTAYKQVRAERDQLAAEFRVFYPEAAARLADFVTRIVTNDYQLQRINTRSKPDGAERLLSAEAVARGLQGFVDGAANIPKITEQLQLPAFEYRRGTLYLWPRR